MPLLATTQDLAASLPGSDFADLTRELTASFDTDFAIWGQDGDVLRPSCAGVDVDDLATAELVRAAATAGDVVFIAEESGTAVLALPLTTSDDRRVVATAAFVTDEAAFDSRRLAIRFGWSDDSIAAWRESQSVWQPEILLRLGRAVAGKLNAEADTRRMEHEIDLISLNLASTYEEISLVYTVTENLRLSRSDEELGQLAIDRLVGCVPATGIALLCMPAGEEGNPTYPARTEPVLLAAGDCPIDRDDLLHLVESLDLSQSSGPFIGNDRITSADSWSFPDIRQLIIVPVIEGKQIFGWLAAFNHTDGDEFGTVEANLLNSVSALLGIHANNRELYREQSELLANLVHALVSAIDAKDPYTSGHSDRVARYAVRIALELKVDPSVVNTIYMAGLLHDVGKIGIDDNVLRKAGRLTDAEFEHIKMHPEIGHKILADIKQLTDVLPAVLHHHEQWDGKGYPRGLSNESIPKIARIMAVADAYDAMTSDRPYRKGMAEEKVDGIFREGSGGYWDPEVVDAFFQAKDDIMAIRNRERRDVNLDEQHWA